MCHARPPPFRGPRAPLSVGGLAGARVCVGVAAARFCARFSPPRAAAGLGAALLPPPLAALERAGCSLNRQRPEGEGCEVSAPTQAPPPPGRPLGAGGGGGLADSVSAPTPIIEGGGGRLPSISSGLPPSPLGLRGAGGTQPSFSSGGGGLFHPKGEGRPCCRAPPPSSRVAAGPRLPDRAERGRDPFFSPPAKVRVPD